MGWGAFSVSFNGLVSLSAIPSEPVSCDEGKLQIIFVTVSLLLHSECSEILIQSSVGCYMIVLELLFIMNWIHYYFFREQLSLLLMNQHRLLIYTVAFLTWVHSPQKNNLCSRRWKKQIIFICTVCLWYENYFTFSLSAFYPNAVNFLFCMKKIFILLFYCTFLHFWKGNSQCNTPSNFLQEVAIYSLHSSNLYQSCHNWLNHLRHPQILKHWNSSQSS